MNKLLLLAFVLFSTVSLCAGQIANQNNDKEIQKIIASLTLKEKAQLLVGTFGNPKDTAYALMVDKVKKFVPGAAGFTAEFASKGISTQVLADGPAGLRIQPTRKGTQETFYCTAFPIATLLASTWDTELAAASGSRASPCSC
jgi:beta-glucosidase